MAIQLIIFFTKTKIFACEINDNGQVDDIIISGNTEIEFKQKESIEECINELINSLYDAFKIDNFSVYHFDIVFVDCGANKKGISYASEKCADADKLSIIGIDKLLPLIVWNKMRLEADEQIVVSFDNVYYKVVCDKNNIVQCTGKTRKVKESIALTVGDFSCLFNFDASKLQRKVIDTGELLNKEAVIEKQKAEIRVLTEALNEKQRLLTDKQNQYLILKEEKAQWEKNHPKPSNLVEQMVEILEKCKDNAKDLGGDLYIKGSIPKKKLGTTLENFSIKFANAGINSEIKKDSVIALYYNHHADNNLNSILITEDFFCYDLNDSSFATLIQWDNLKHVEEDDDYILFTFTTGKTHYMSMDDETVMNDFFIPLFREMSKIDVFE